MEYCIAGDDGSAGIWNRPFDVDLDGDGRLDAIGLDLDGDGLRDDALADFDGDDVPTTPYSTSTTTAPRKATSSTTDRGPGRSPSTAADNCAGMGSTASSTPVVHWLTSTGSVV